MKTKIKYNNSVGIAVGATALLAFLLISIYFADAATTIGTNISTGGSVTATGNLIIGNGTPGVTQNGEDGYIKGTFEVDGASQFDGAVTANGNVIIPIGSVSVPSVAFSGDSNTGFYSTGADNLSITVGGTKRFSASEDTQAVTITGTTTPDNGAVLNYIIVN